MPHRNPLHLYQPTALAVIPLVLVGCAGAAKTPPPHTPVDLSSPKPAALTFLRALQNADPAVARQVSVSTEGQKRWIDSFTALIGAMRQYDQALTGRFGQRAADTDVQLKQALVTMTEDPITGVEGGTVQQDDQAGVARLLPGMRGIRLAARPPIDLRRTRPGQWKVDLTSSANDPRFNPAVAAQYQAAADVMRQVAEEVAAGHYKSVEAAEAAMDQRMRAANVGTGGL